MEFNATFIISAISFIVFVFVMNTVLYRPLERIVDEREKLITGNYDTADKLKAEAKTMLEKKAVEIAQAKASAKNNTDEKLKKEYDKSSEKIKQEKENCLNYIKEQKEILHSESENFEKNMEENIENYAKFIAEKLLNSEVKNG